MRASLRGGSRQEPAQAEKLFEEIRAPPADADDTLPPAVRLGLVPVDLPPAAAIDLDSPDRHSAERLSMEEAAAMSTARVAARGVARLAGCHGAPAG